MPIADYEDPAYAEWANSSVKQWEVRLHPLGETYVFDFFMEATGDIDKQRLRLFGIQVQIVMHVIVLYIFARNLAIARKMVMLLPRSLMSWCCLASSASSVVSITMAVFMFVNFPINCRIMTWLFISSISINMMGNSLILLQKVYLALCQKNWIVYISIPVIAAQFAFTFIFTYNSYVILEEKVGCMNYYPQFVLWYWFIVNVPINVLFSAIFCYIALKHYRILGSEVWKRLARDGIQAMSLATLCNIIGPIITIVPISKSNTDLFFLIDWMVVTTILINHCQNASKNIDTAHNPKTYHMLNISQIATVKSLDY